MNIDIIKIWLGWIITDRLDHVGFGYVYKYDGFSVTKTADLATLRQDVKVSVQR